jgi:hypothetical protein
MGIKETGVTYHKIGFSSTKTRTDDLEHFFNCGFTRCGSYIYMRNSKKSCCEVWQYRVDANEFVMSNS